MTDKDKPSNRDGDLVDVWYNASALPIDLFDGRMVAPGTVLRESIPMNQHNKFHADTGSLKQLTRAELAALDAKEKEEVTNG